MAAGLNRRADWTQRRLAVMPTLLRARFSANPDIVHALLDTGDGRIEYQPTLPPVEGGYWTTAGANWHGRLLEIIRSEYAITRT